MIPFTFATGQHLIFNGIVEFEVKNDCCHIHRIAVDADHRRKGEATRILQFLSLQAAEAHVVLSACICPDDPDRSITEGLQRAFSRAGFVPFEEDGECYPNDVSFNQGRDIAPTSLHFS